MINAQKAKELTDAWIADRNKAYQEMSEQKLADIYARIEENAKKGLSVCVINNKNSFFKAQEIESIVRKKLYDLGYTIGTSGSSLTIRW